MLKSTNNNCPFCKSSIKEDDKKIDCIKCGIPHHEECWNENGGCSTFGCSDQGGLNSQSNINFDITPSSNSVVQLNQTVTRKCPFCREDILADAIKCKHCGEWLNNKETLFESHGPITQQFSNAQPIWHLIILSILTFNIYEIYWFYRNWKQLKEYKSFDISPGWRTVGLFVPIYGLCLVYSQLKDIKDLSKAEYSPGMFLFVFALINVLYRLPDPFWLLSLFSVLPLAMVQGVLNSYWGIEQLGLQTRTKFSGGEIAILIIGGIIFILGMIGTFM